jgi:hypothetical protein
MVAEVEGGEEEEDESFRRVKTSFLMTCGPGILSLVPVPAAWLAGGAGVADTALLSLAATATLPSGSCALVALFCPVARLATRPLVRIRGAAADCPVFPVVGLPALTVVTVWAVATRVDACSLLTGSSDDVIETSDFALKEQQNFKN